MKEHSYPIPEREAERLAALRELAILDTPAEAEFDEITRLAAVICGTPIALISLIDEDRQWFKSRLGLDVQETPRQLAFCAHTIHGHDVLEIPDALADERFRDNPLVIGDPRIRFYAGASLTTSEGLNLGTLCVIDRIPHLLTAEQREALATLSRQVMRQVRLISAERRLREAHSRMAHLAAFQQAVLDSTPAAIITGDKRGIITSFNATAEALLGYRAEEMVGKETPGIFHDRAEVVLRAHELSRELGRPVEPGFEVFVANVRQGETETREWTYVRKDGSRVPVLLTVSELRDAEGRQNGYLGVARELAEPTGTSGATLIFQPPPEPRPQRIDLWIWMLVGLAFLLLPWAGNTPAILAPVLLALGALAYLSHQQRKKLEHWLQSQLTRMVDEVNAGRAIKSELRHSEAKLRVARNAAEAASRAKSEFLATMSHEIRTPMNGVIGAIGLLLEGSLTRQQRELAEIARASGDSLLAIINDILDFSKIEAGKMQVESTPFDLQRSLDEIASIFAPQVAEKKLALIFAQMPDLPRFFLGDIGRIRQVLANLVGNAVKFTEKGQVTVRVEGEALPPEAAQVAEPQIWRLRLAVEDTGIGIAPEALTRLFGSFEQADASTTRRFGGTGLGLAISKRLVELMGGRLSVDSQVGVGSTFSFRLDLPVVDAPAYSAELGAVGPETWNARVLLVDDNSINQKVAKLMLENFGCRVDLAGNGLEATSLYQQLPYDVIFMDCEMPELDGFEATRRIRVLEDKLIRGETEMGRAFGSGRALARVPIVAMTAKALAGDRQRCLDAGMNDYLSKPVQTEALAKALRKWLPADKASPAAEPKGPESTAEDRPKTDPASAPALDDDVLASLGRVLGTGPRRRSTGFCKVSSAKRGSRSKPSAKPWRKATPPDWPSRPTSCAAAASPSAPNLWPRCSSSWKTSAAAKRWSKPPKKYRCCGGNGNGCGSTSPLIWRKLQALPRLPSPEL